MYYGNPSAPNEQQPPAVWSNSYVAVYHFSNYGSLSVADSTNTFNGTNNNAQSTTGMIGGAANFIAPNNAFILLPVTGLFSAGIPFTVSGWMNPADNQTDNVLFESCPTSGGVTDECLFLVVRSGTPTLGLYNDNVWGGSISPGVWSHLTFTYDGSHIATVYINGNVAADGLTAGVLNVPAGALTYTGGPSIAANNSNFTNAANDELEISNVVRSQGWIVTEYNNQSSPTTFGSMNVSATPTSFAVVASTATANLSWVGSSAATTYSVKMGYHSGGPYLTIASVTGTSFTATGLTNGITYYFVVSAVDGTGESGNSSEADGTPIAIPANVTAAVSNGDIYLAWQPTLGASTYSIQRSTNSGAFVTIATGLSGTSYIDSNVTHGNSYAYTVSGVNSTGQSLVSNTAYAHP